MDLIVIVFVLVSCVVVYYLYEIIKQLNNLIKLQVNTNNLLYEIKSKINITSK